MKIGDEVYVHGYVDEVRKDAVIIRNEGGYFGTAPDEVMPSAQPEIIRCEDCMHNGSFDTDCPIRWNGKEYCSFAERRTDE